MCVPLTALRNLIKKQPLALGQLQNEALQAFAWVIDPHIQIIAIQYKHGTALRQNNIDIIPCLPFSRKTMLNEACQLAQIRIFKNLVP